MAIVKIQVEKLIPGLYVSKLDRPWTETPFLFQGFEIRSQEEIRILRKYCRFVWVDDVRSHTPFPSESPSASRQTAVHDLKQRFHEGLGPVQDARELTRTTLSRVMLQLRQRGQFDFSDVSVAIRELKQQLDRYPDIALWLAAMKGYHDILVDHAINTCSLALLVCREMQLDSGQQAEIGVGALLHEVGKLALPRSLIFREGPIDEEERRKIRRYPVHGERILINCGVHERVARIVRHHQERLDGSGFPDGLKGEALDLSPRVVGLCNAYDAMTSDWPRAPAMSGQQALAHISGQARNRWGHETAAALTRALGVYPPGSHVMLESGACGIVIRSQPASRLKPSVVIYRNERGEPVKRMSLLDLSHSDNGQHITGVMSPGENHQQLMKRITQQLIAA